MPYYAINLHRSRLKCSDLDTLLRWNSEAESHLKSESLCSPNSFSWKALERTSPVNTPKGSSSPRALLPKAAAEMSPRGGSGGPQRSHPALPATLTLPGLSCPNASLYERGSFGWWPSVVQGGNTFHFKAEWKRGILLIFILWSQFNPPRSFTLLSGAIFIALKPCFKSTDGSWNEQKQTQLELDWEQLY